MQDLLRPHQHFPLAHPGIVMHLCFGCESLSAATAAAVCLIIISSHQAHSCFQKAVMIVGLQHMRKLEAHGDTLFAVQPQQLAEAVAADLQQGLIPFYFMGTIGRW